MRGSLLQRAMSPLCQFLTLAATKAGAAYSRRQDTYIRGCPGYARWKVLSDHKCRDDAREA
jgi:hypothetical protein